MTGERMKIDLPYVRCYRARGKLYCYYRRDERQIRLKGDPGSADFAAHYEAVHRGWDAPGGSVLYGSLAWLVQEYRADPRFQRLKPATKASYERYLAELLDGREAADWRTVTRAKVIAVRNKHQDSPRRANYFVQLLSILGEVAIDRDIRTDNPAKGVEKLKGGAGWRAWEPEELLWCEGLLPPGPLRLAYFLALYTGQREADVLAMTWRSIEDGMIEVTQSKTGATVWIPVHATLREELDTADRRGFHIVSTQAGRAYSLDGFKSLWWRFIKDAGLPGVQFHGLRKNATAALAEAGCTTEQIKAITGHKTDAMVTFYTKSARQKLLARQAMRLLSNREIAGG
jgi:integrase